MKLLHSWFTRRWPKRTKEQQADIVFRCFATPGGREWLMFMLDEIVMSPPEELDGEEWKAWVVRVKFVTDIVRAIDALEDPAKYEAKQPEVKPMVRIR